MPGPKSGDGGAGGHSIFTRGREQIPLPDKPLRISSTTGMGLRQPWREWQLGLARKHAARFGAARRPAFSSWTWASRTNGIWRRKLFTYLGGSSRYWVGIFLRRCGQAMANPGTLLPPTPRKKGCRRGEKWRNGDSPASRQNNLMGGNHEHQ